MPRRQVLTDVEVQSLLAFPFSPEEIVQYYTLSEEDLILVRQHRGDIQRLGFAVLLCAMRYPGILLSVGAEIPEPILKFVAGQLGVDADLWPSYAKRLQTRRDHLVELQKVYGFRIFNRSDYKSLLKGLEEPATLTDRGPDIGVKLIELLSEQKILAPTPEIIKAICSEAVGNGTRGNPKTSA